MAKPIEFKPAPHDARDELRQRVENAPLEHSAAVLSTYELLEYLHQSGMLNLLCGAVSAGGEIVSQASSLAAQPEAVRVMRNLLVMGKLLGSIDPDLLQRFAQTLSATADAPRRKPPSLFELLRRFKSPDSRRALSAAADVLEGVGRGLSSGK